MIFIAQFQIEGFTAESRHGRMVDFESNPAHITLDV
jgi:hypothetical protein